MNKTKSIEKYPITNYLGDTVIHMPEMAEIISVEINQGNVWMWAIVAPANPSRAYYFEAVPTGGDMPALPYTFLKTLLFPSGEEVHLFYINI